MPRPDRSRVRWIQPLRHLWVAIRGTLCIVLFLAASSGASWSLTLGEASALQVSDALIEMYIDVGEEPDDRELPLIARVATPEEFAAFGMVAPPWRDRVSFTIIRAPSGGRRLQVAGIPTSTSISELLVYVSSGNNAYLRSYTIGASMAAVRSADTSGTPPALPVTSAEQPARAAASRRPASKQTVSPSPTPPDVLVTRPGDTALGIARTIQIDGTGAQQVAVALYQRNPDAFGGNIHRLRAGKRLVIPEVEKVRALPAAVAQGLIREQWEQQRADASEGAPGGGRERERRGVASDRLSLGSALSGSEVNLTRPESEAAYTAALDELASRVRDLERIQSQLQNLISLREQQISKVEAALKELTLAPVARPAAAQSPMAANGMAPPAVPGAPRTDWRIAAVIAGLCLVAVGIWLPRHGASIRTPAPATLR